MTCGRLRHVMGMKWKLLPRVRPNDTSVICRAAMRHARSTLDDEAARAMLDQEVGDRRASVGAAVDALRRDRFNFLGDRAYRLLDAVARVTPVDVIAAENLTLFAREEELGRTRMDVAYSRLAELEPRLGCLAEQGSSAVPEADTAPPPPKRVHSARSERNGRAELRGLVGPSAQHPDALVRSELALSIALQYAAILSGELSREGMTSSYFCAHRRIAVRAGTLLGPDLRSSWTPRRRTPPT